MHYNFVRTPGALLVGLAQLTFFVPCAGAEGGPKHSTEPVTVTAPSADSLTSPNMVHQHPAWTMSPPVVTGSDPKGIRTIRILPEEPAATYFAQVSAQATEAEAKAAFAALQSRFPALLGEREAEIRQARPGDRGSYHRVLVGPFETIAEANEVCTAIKTGGGPCTVQRN